MKPLHIILVRPVGSDCWTVETIAGSPSHAELSAAELRNEKIHFADGSVHLQSTAIVCAMLPKATDATQQHYESGVAATVMRGIA